MLIDNDITPVLVEKYYQAHALGTLAIHIPGIIKIGVNMSRLFRYVTGMKSFEYQIPPETIEAVVIYGSVLYKHFQATIITEKQRKKWWLIGPTITTRVVTQMLRSPHDFDVMAILKSGITQDKIIIPKRVSISTGYGSYEQFQTGSDSGVSSERPMHNFYGYIEGWHADGDLPLHITFRSTEQFLNGLGHGDELSESVVKMGVPLFGQDKFYQIIRGITEPRREALHTIGFEEDSNGKLVANIN